MTQSMGEVRRILCAVDLTQRSDAALMRAVLLARDRGARLTVLHVVDSRQAERVVRMQANRAYVELLSQIERLFGSVASSIDVAVRRGKRREVIASSAQEWDVDLIVLASPTARRVDSIIGTTAERLIRQTKRSVLVVRSEASDVYRRVAIATELSAAAVPMMRTAVRLGALQDASAAIIHAAHPSYDSMLRVAGIDEATIHGYQRSSEAEAREQLQGMINEATLPFSNTRVIVRSDPPSHAIRAVLEYERPELLAIGASRWFMFKRLLIGSVADELLRAVSCDVLVIPHHPKVLRVGAAVTTDDLSVPYTRRDAASLPGFVAVQSRLHEHDGRDGRRRAQE